MSLASHVTQVEGFDYEGPANQAIRDEVHAQEEGLSPPCDAHGSLPPPPFAYPASPVLHSVDNKSEWRAMNFAVPKVREEEPHIAAYKVSTAKRVLQVATGVIVCWLASGIVFGFAALKPILIAEGVYSDLCPPSDVSPSATSHRNPCAEQDLRLNMFFTAAVIAANMSSLVAGTVLDRFGRRACWLSSCLLIACGCAIMSASFAFPGLDAYLLANVLLACGGTFLFIPTFQLANAFPKHSGLIVALVTGAFDASAAVYLFYRMAYEYTAGAFSVEKFFLAYMAVPVLIFVVEMVYMPPCAYHTLPELEDQIERVQDPSADVHESDEDVSSDGEVSRRRSARAGRRLAKLDRMEGLAGDAEEREGRVREREERQENSVVWGVLHGVPAHRQVVSPWYLFILALTVLQMLRMNYFIATVRSQYRYMLGSEEEAEKINHFFDAALPVGGVLSTPVIGVLLNNLSVPANFGILTVFIVAIGVANCLPYVWAGYLTVILFVIFRPLYYSAISDYATKVFGFATFGRIYGTLICTAGLFNFAQSGLDALTHGPLLRGDPTAINVGVGVASALVGTAMTMFVAVKGRRFARRREEGEGDDERRLLLGVEEFVKYDL